MSNGKRYDNCYNRCSYCGCEPCQCEHEHKHTGCNPPPPCNHKFKPVPGESPMECCNRLYGAVNAMACEFKQAMDCADGMIKKLEQKSIYNGAYYDGVVTVEEGWSDADSTAYKIIRIPAKDKGNCPIKLNLHLAYGNTTNSKLNETVFSASENELADKMFTAARGDDENGWGGLARYMGAPIPSFNNPALYTLGVTQNGRLHWYKNTVSEEQLTRDCVVNSLGVTGVLVNANVATTAEMWGLENTTPQKTARVVMGQNYETNEIIVLVVGDYDKINEIIDGKEYGMYPSTAANLMAGYCTFAVNVSLGGGDYGSAAVDKGEMLFTPSNAVIQNNYAYWYISRKASYQNNYTFESATLRQLYGQLKWQYDLIDDVNYLLQDQINDEVSRASARENEIAQTVTDEKNRAMAAEKKLTEDLQSEVERASDAEQINADDITAEKNRAIGRENQIAGTVTAETTRATAAEQANATAINAEKTRAVQAESANATNIANEIDRAKHAESDLANNIGYNYNVLDGKISAEVTRSTNKDTSHDSSISILTNDISLLKKVGYTYLYPTTFNNSYKELPVKLGVREEFGNTGYVGIKFTNGSFGIADDTYAGLYMISCEVEFSNVNDADVAIGSVQVKRTDGTATYVAISNYSYLRKLPNGSLNQCVRLTALIKFDNAQQEYSILAHTQNATTTMPFTTTSYPMQVRPTSYIVRVG